MSEERGCCEWAGFDWGGGKGERERKGKGRSEMKRRRREGIEIVVMMMMTMMMMVVVVVKRQKHIYPDLLIHPARASLSHILPMSSPFCDNQLKCPSNFPSLRPLRASVSHSPCASVISAVCSSSIRPISHHFIPSSGALGPIFRSSATLNYLSNLPDGMTADRQRPPTYLPHLARFLNCGIVP